MPKDNGFFTKPGVKLWALCCVFLAGILTLIASGGGGGSAGTVTQTEITAANAEQVALNAYLQSKAAVDAGTGSFETVKTRGQNQESGSGSPQALALTFLVLDFLDRTDLASSPAQKSVSSTRTEVITGTCGGQVEVTTTVDITDQEFFLEANFSDFCLEVGTLLNGTMAITGTMDLRLDRILSFSATLASFNIVNTKTGDSSTISGIMAMTLTDYDALSGLLDLSITDDIAGKTYIIDSLTLSLDGLTSSVLTFALSGGFVDPDNGTFTLQTTTPFKINRIDSLPFQGVLLIVAADNTRAELTVHSTTSYQVRADTDGDGIYDFDTGIVSWQ